MTHEQRLEAIFKRLLADGDYKKYKREDFEDFVWSYHIEDFVPVIAHFYVPKGVIPPDETMEVFSEQQIRNVLCDKTKLKDFVKAVADGKIPTAEEATTVLKSLTNELLC